jgi:hypothetical protein
MKIMKFQAVFAVCRNSGRVTSGLAVLCNVHGQEHETAEVRAF